MNCTSVPEANPIEQYIDCFDTAIEAANAADISTEMLRKMRHRGYVTTRDRALVMAAACKGRVKPAQLLALPARRAS